jgi:tetratricopeptide (TPR) repeat protein/DNA-binding XRE family transcriptional regulator
MPEKIPPPLGLTLTILRSAQGWSQKRLAEASGVRKTMISDFEVGRRPLSQARLESLAAVLGYGRESIDAALLCLEWVRPPVEVSTSPLGPGPDERRIIEQASTRVAKTVLDATRSTLTSRLRADRARQARREADEQWERLKRYSPRDRRLLVEGAKEFQTWALCERLCAESEKAAAADANRALELADLALRVAVLVPGEEGWRSRVQGYAWAHVGNARRVGGNLLGADEAFARFDALWKSEVSGPLDEAHVVDLKASLRKHQGRFDEALVLHEQALRLVKPDDSGYIVLNLAITLEQMGNYERAITTLMEAAPLISEQRRRLRLALQFNLAVNLCHLARHAEAEMLLREIRELAVELGNELDLVRILWLQGRVAAGLARNEEAISALAQVRAEFASRGITYDAALASLELAALYLEHGRATEVKALAKQMAPIFQTQGVHREALAALRLFCEAAEHETVTTDLARRIVEYLQRARHDPRLRFEI